MTEIEDLVRLLPWDSEFFGHRIAKVLPSTLNTEDIHKLDAWCHKEQVDCVYFLSSSTGGPALWPTQDYGFHLVDLRVTLAADLAKLVLPSSQNKVICLAVDTDIPDLRSIAAHNHVDSRFYADTHFEQSKCDALYEVWVEKSVKDPKTKVFTYKPKGKALGYVSSYIDEFSKAFIGLVGISKECQGQGIGTQLINQCLQNLQSEGCSQAEVVTQGRNTKAIQLYEKCGFRVKSIQTWFHKWYE